MLPYIEEIIAEAQLRNAHAEYCECHERLLVGLSDDWCAHVARVDANPVTPYGEMQARLWGLASYSLHRQGEQWRLYIRDHWQIAGRPAGTLVRSWRADVVVEHLCDLTPQLPIAPSVYQATQTVTVDPAAPPPF